MLDTFSSGLSFLLFFLPLTYSFHYRHSQRPHLFSSFSLSTPIPLPLILSLFFEHIIFAISTFYISSILSGRHIFILPTFASSCSSFFAPFIFIISTSNHHSIVSYYSFFFILILPFIIFYYSTSASSSAGHFWYILPTSPVFHSFSSLSTFILIQSTLLNPHSVTVPLILPIFYYHRRLFIFLLFCISIVLFWSLHFSSFLHSLTNC